MGKVLEFSGSPPPDEEPPMTVPKKRPKPSPKTEGITLTEDGAPDGRQTEHYQEQVERIRQEQVERVREVAAPVVEAEPGYQVVLGVDVSLTGTGLAWLESPSGDRLTARLSNPARATADDIHRAVGAIPKGSPVPLGVRLDRLCSHVTIAVGDNWSPLPKLAVIERPFSNPKTPGTNVLLGMAQAAVLIALTRMYIPVVFVPPKTRAKFATGNGNAGKPDVLTAAVEQFGYQGTHGQTEPTSDISKVKWSEHYDHADALILAVIGGHLLGEGFEIPELLLYDEQYEALAALPDLSDLMGADDEGEE